MNNYDLPFSEEEYYSWYKHIRNKFRKYNSLDVINACVDYLYKPEKDKISELQKLPWLVILLIKWVLLDDEFYVKNKKQLNRKVFFDILQLMRDTGGKARLPSQFEHTILFMRCMSYQQLMYQHKFSLSYLSRQMILFGTLPDNHYISKHFKLDVGLSISEFLELVLITLTRFMENNSSTLQVNWFDSLSNHYTKESIQNFLNSISISLDDLRNNLRENGENRRRSQEYYEQTPFLEYPLIRNGGNYISFLPIILYRSMEHFIYDRMRKINAERFMDKFGDIFERYVEKTLSYASVDYINEKDIIGLLGHSGNLIDFIVLENDANIFIDAKATEMSYSGKVAHLSQVLKDKTKNSVLKAIKQAHDVLNRIDNISVNNKSISKNKNFLLVVTFKDLFLGNGRTFYETTAKDKIDEIYREYSGKQIIELEDMYFISIEQFDILTELVKKGVVTYTSAIEKAKIDDSAPESKKFDFWLHMASWGHPLDIPDFLNSEGERMFGKLGAMLK